MPIPSSCCHSECQLNSGVKDHLAPDTGAFGIFTITGGQPSYAPTQLQRETFQRYQCLRAEPLLKKVFPMSCFPLSPDWTQAIRLERKALLITFSLNLSDSQEWLFVLDLRDKRKVTLVPAVNVRDNLIVFISPYFVHFIYLKLKLFVMCIRP